MDRMPRRLPGSIWAHTQDYWREKDELPAIDLDGAEFDYGGVAAKAKTPEPA
jgi:hypothetical protein